MQTLIAILAAALTMAFLEFGVTAGKAQAGYCEYRDIIAAPVAQRGSLIVCAFRVAG